MEGARVMLDLRNVWDFDYMWEIFAFLLKVVAPFVMIIIAILGVGALIYLVVKAVKAALDK